MARTVGRRFLISLGFAGVFQLPSGSWAAFITVQKERRYLRAHASFEQAVAVRKAAELEFFGEFRHDA